MSSRHKTYRCENFRCYQWRVRLRERDVRPLLRLHDGRPGEKRFCRACGGSVSVAAPSDVGPIVVAWLTFAAALVPVLTRNAWARYFAALFIAVVFSYVMFKIITRTADRG